MIAAWAIGEDGRKVLLHLMAIPPTFFQQICTSINPLERLNGEIKRRTDVVGI